MQLLHASLTGAGDVVERDVEIDAQFFATRHIDEEVIDGVSAQEEGEFREEEKEDQGDGAHGYCATPSACTHTETRADSMSERRIPIRHHPRRAAAAAG